MIQTNPLPTLSATKIRTGLSSLEVLVERLIRQYEQQSELPSRTRRRRSQHQPASRIKHDTNGPATVLATASSIKQQPARQTTFAWYD